MVGPSPEVTVIIPVYNRSALLKRAVASVQSQTFGNWECLVIDDGSTPPCHFIADRDDRVRVIRCPHNLGPARGRNVGAHLAKGRYLAFLDSDDYWLPDKLDQQVAHAQQGWKLLQCREHWVRNGKKVAVLQRHRPEEGWLFERSLEDICISPSSVMLDRDFFWSLGGFREEFPVCEDYEFFLRAALITPVGLCENPLTVKCAGHADQLSAEDYPKDLFRVYALLLLGVGKEHVWCYRDRWLQSLLKRVSIIASGAQKRKNTILLQAITEFQEGLSCPVGWEIITAWEGIVATWSQTYR